MTAAFLVELIHLRLQYHAHALHEEDTAQHRHHELLVNDHRAHTDDTAYGQTARVTQEHLCREAVEPEVTHQCTDKRSQEHHQLFTARDVHHIEILGPYDTTARVGENEQGDSDDRRVTGTHTVHAVVQVRTVAYRGHNEHRQQHKEDPAGTVFILLAQPREQVGVVEVMMLHERDRCLRGLDLRRLLHDGDVVLNMTRHHFVHGRSRCKTQRQTDDQSQRYLPAYLHPAVQTVFVLAEGLDVVVCKTQRTHQHGGDQHQDHIDVAQLTEQQAR